MTQTTPIDELESTIIDTLKQNDWEKPETLKFFEDRSNTSVIYAIPCDIAEKLNFVKGQKLDKGTLSRYLDQNTYDFSVNHTNQQYQLRVFLTYKESIVDVLTGQPYISFGRIN